MAVKERVYSDFGGIRVDTHYMGMKCLSLYDSDYGAQSLSL